MTSQEIIESCESSDPESIDSIQRFNPLTQKNSNFKVSDLTGNLVSDSVVVNIESENSTISNESNSTSDNDDDESEDIDEGIEEQTLHHNDWEVRMLAAELKKRESISEPQKTMQKSENDRLLRRRKRQSDTDTDASENEISRYRPRAASLDQQNLRDNQYKNRGFSKAMSFDSEKNEL